jgi:CIC family chloride channel protein
MRVGMGGVPVDTELKEIYRHFENSDSNSMPIVNSDGSFYGVIYLKDLRMVLARHEADNLIIASDIAARDLGTVTEDDSLTSAFAALGIRDNEVIPVAAGGNPQTVVGLLYRIDLLNYYNRILSERTAKMKEL